MKKRIVSAAVYDSIKFMADANGGIGAGKMYETGSFDSAPVCGIGMLHAAGLIEPGAPPPTADLGVSDVDSLYDYVGDEMARQITALIPGFSWEVNDDAVNTINRRNGYIDSRVPFELWAAELNIVRGDDD